MNTSDVTQAPTHGQSLKFSSSYLYHLQNLSVNFGDVKALQGINLTISSGEVVFVTGPSGAGKTTLLKVLSGEVKPSKGVLKNYQNSANKKVFATKVFQESRLIEALSCEENLLLSYDPKLYPSKSEYMHDLLELAQYLGAKDQLGMKVANANGGLKQKISMLRALLAKPDVVLADEPTGSLDRTSAFRMFELLSFYNSKRKLTVLWATHNRDLVKQFTGKMLHLENGKLVYTGHACFI